MTDVDTEIRPGYPPAGTPDATVPGPRSGDVPPHGGGTRAADRDSPAPEQPRMLHAKTTDDRASVLGSQAAGAGLAWIITGEIVPMHGWFAFLLLWHVCFLAIYAVVTMIANPWTVVADRLAGSLVRTGAILVLTILLSAVIFIFVKGWPALHHVNFYVHDMAGVEPSANLKHGGVLHTIEGSLIEIGLAVAVTLPLGLGTAIFMVEIGGRFARVVRTVVEAMTALPSIVAGLFIYTVLIVTMHFPRSGFAAAMALSVMMLPIIARAADVVLRVVPSGLREAGLALGSTQWSTLWHVILPTARPGLATALILGVARGVGETSPVLLTSGASTYFNDNPVSQDMNSLPLFIFTAVRSGVTFFIQRGYGAASVLLIIVLVLFAVARRLARQRGGSS